MTDELCSTSGTREPTIKSESDNNNVINNYVHAR